MTKERSGTTRSQRTRNQKSLTAPPFDFWFLLKQNSGGGQAGEGMRVLVAGTLGDAVAPWWSCLGKVLLWVQETGVWGMLYIPQRHYICTDRCLRANLRRRGGFPAAELQVRQKKKRQILQNFQLVLSSFISRSLTFLRGIDAKSQLLSGVCFVCSSSFTLGRFLRVCTP